VTRLRVKKKKRSVNATNDKMRRKKGKEMAGCGALSRRNKVKVFRVA